MCSTFARRCAAVLALLVLPALAGCGGDVEAPETRVRAVIDGLQSAVERGSLQDAAALVHRDYRDRRHAGKREAMGTLFAYLRRHRDIHLFTLVRELAVDPGGRTARAEVLVAMGAVPMESLDSVVSLRADLYRFDVGFVLDDDAWQVGESRWTRVRAADLVR